MSAGVLTRRAVLALWDSIGWILAVTAVVLARYDHYLEPAQWSAVGAYTALVIVLQLMLGATVKVYLGRYRLGSFDEIVGLALTTAVAAVIGGVGQLVIATPTYFPRGVAVLAPPIALLVMSTGRWAYRMWTNRAREVRGDAESILVYGAGDVGHQLLGLLQSDDRSEYRPVGLIDDDPAKKNLRILGIRVLGDRHQLVAVARRLARIVHDTAA